MPELHKPDLLRRKEKSLQGTKRRTTGGISSVRIRVEHAIGRLRHFAVLRNVYVGSDGRPYRDLQIISGLVNHRTLWDRDAKKPGLGL
ncbi:MAG: hypothetical protein OXP12_09090 [Thaumarchaeota archaeon]|nr:hypothetical protein [Nitrososphaerota archaeon]MDE0267358.1 hypothetical protein [Nitrososphaerota archaeon]MDE0525828.1 hypothetical protein [Nitrososphaerota archaeon]